MSRAMRTAASGMLAQQMQVDTIANNIANVNTSAFKRNRVSFRSLLYTTLREPGSSTSATQMNPTGLQLGSGTEVSSSVKLFLQGDPEPTSNSYDMFINGDGFFRVATGDGTFRYTRDGSFRVDGNGDIVTVDGLRLEPGINIPDNVDQVSIGSDGLIQGRIGDSIQTIGQIRLSRFPNPNGLRADGANFFRETPSSGGPVEQTPGEGGSGTIRQSFLERSNVAIVDELIALIQAQRNYEVNSRTISVSDEMMQQVSQLI